MKKAVGIGVVAGAIVVAVATLAVVLCTRAEQSDSRPDDETNVAMTDAQKFKESYESLNGTTREGSDRVYSAIEIPENNPIKYVTVAEALEVLDKPEAVLYAGANWCPWCRGVVPVLLDVAREYGIKELYYLNLDDDKSLFEIQDGKLVETRHGSDDYYKLLEKLSDNLRNYVLTDDDGKEYDTGEKRVYQPDVYGIKNGKIVARVNSTVKLDDGQTAYDALTTAQKQEIKKEYEKLFTAVYDKPSDTCGTKDDGCE